MLGVRREVLRSRRGIDRIDSGQEDLVRPNLPVCLGGSRNGRDRDERVGERGGRLRRQRNLQGGQVEDGGRDGEAVANAEAGHLSQTTAPESGPDGGSFKRLLTWERWAFQ